MANAPANPTSIRLRPIGLWLPGAVVAGLAVGWGATLLQRTLAATTGRSFAPLLLFPLLLGLACGGLLAGWLRVTHMAQRRVAVVGTMLAALAVTGSQHYVSYRIQTDSLKSQSRMGLDAMAAMGLPDSFESYMRHEAQRGRSIYSLRLVGAAVWTLWTVEALLVVAGALLVVIPTVRRPYCPRCHTWYKTIRQGVLSRTTAQRIADWRDGSVSDLPTEYRLLACQEGCGPMGLALAGTAGTSVAKPGGKTPALLWLEDDRRRELLTLLDRDVERARTQSNE